MIDLDTPPAPAQQRRSVRIPLPAVLGLTVAAAAVAAYVTHRTDHVRVVAVSAAVSAQAGPGVRLGDGEVELDGVLTITNTGLTPIRLAGVRMDPARVTVKGSALGRAIDPGVTSSIGVTATLTCAGKTMSTLDSEVSITVGESAGSAPISFENLSWGLQMLRACRID